MKKIVSLFASLSIGLVSVVVVPISVLAAGGFNQYGYNYGGRVFSGAADGVDKNLDGTVWGDPTYANDHLVMKWNSAWDACNANGYDNPAYCGGAWTTNEWNGMASNGSQTNWHYKIIWVGSAGQASAYWVDGGYSVWGNYEVISDQGMDKTTHQHTVYAQGIPNGLK